MKEFRSKKKTFLPTSKICKRWWFSTLLVKVSKITVAHTCRWQRPGDPLQLLHPSHHLHLHLQSQGEDGWARSWSTTFIFQSGIPSCSYPLHNNFQNTGNFNHHFSVLLFLSVWIFGCDWKPLVFNSHFFSLCVHWFTHLNKALSF